MGRWTSAVFFTGSSSTTGAVLAMQRRSLKRRPPVSVGSIGGAAKAHTGRRKGSRVVRKSIVMDLGVVKSKWKMEGEVDGRRKGGKGEMTVHIYSPLGSC